MHWLAAVAACSTEGEELWKNKGGERAEQGQVSREQGSASTNCLVLNYAGRRAEQPPAKQAAQLTL